MFTRKEAPWGNELSELKTRWFSFLEKLESRMDEFTNEALPELKQVFETDEDLLKREFSRFSSSIEGQLNTIREKASDMLDNKITDSYSYWDQQINFDSSYHNELMMFRNICIERHEAFEDQFNAHVESIKNIGRKENLEEKYQDILNQYEEINDTFKCTQCGSPIIIEKIFFISTYIDCPSCMSKNTFEPSTQAKSLQHFSHDLAHQRCKELLEKYEEAEEREREIYYEKHEIEISLIHETSRRTKKEKEATLAALENERQKTIKHIPQLYNTYLRRKYEELDKIMPDMKEHHQKRLSNELKPEK